MSSIVIAGDTSGSVTLQAPAVSGSTVVNLPSTLGNVSTSAFVTTDASGNLGLGVTPVVGIEVLRTGNAYAVFRGGSTSNAQGLLVGQNSAGDGLLYNGLSSGNLLFYTNATERARINSSGFLKASNTGSYIGSTGPYYEFTSNDISTNQSFIFYNNNTSIAQTAMMFLGANRNTTNNTFYYFGCYNYQTSTYKMLIADSGNITNTNNSYGAISDVKLKENIVDASPKLADLMQVKIRSYNMIGDPTKQLGVIAQELEAVFPAMIDVSPDRDAEGNDLGTTTKSVKYSVFVPMLIKAIQEQQALITTLTDRISVLENK